MDIVQKLLPICLFCFYKINLLQHFVSSICHYNTQHTLSSISCRITHPLNEKYAVGPYGKWHTVIPSTRSYTFVLFCYIHTRKYQKICWLSIPGSPRVSVKTIKSVNSLALADSTNYNQRNSFLVQEYSTINIYIYIYIYILIIHH